MTPSVRYRLKKRTAPALRPGGLLYNDAHKKSPYLYEGLLISLARSERGHGPWGGR